MFYYLERYLTTGWDSMTPLPFVVIYVMFWQRRSASYLVNMRSVRSKQEFTPDLMFTKYEADPKPF